MRYFLTFLVACLAPLSAAAISPTQPIPHVVVTLKPLHSLVAGVMQNVGEPVLLVPPAASAHTFTLRPSQMRDLHRADAIFMMSHEFERFMEKPLESVTHQKKIKELSKAPGLVLYPTRQAPHVEEEHEEGAHEGEEHEAHEHEHSLTDYHAWLDPDNAIAMVRYIAATLSEIDSAHATLYTLNAGNMEKKLQGLDKEIRRFFASKDKTGATFTPYLTYHDAYQYFEKHYDLAPSGFITQNPERALGAKSIETLQDSVKFSIPNCIFAEPQFSAKVIHELSLQTGAKVKVVDPIGLKTPLGEEGYFLMMQTLAEQFAECSRLQGGHRDFGF